MTRDTYFHADKVCEFGVRCGLLLNARGKGSEMPHEARQKRAPCSQYYSVTVGHTRDWRLQSKQLDALAKGGENKRKMSAARRKQNLISTNARDMVLMHTTARQHTHTHTIVMHGCDALP